jgi:predicted metal-binding protein
MKLEPFKFKRIVAVCSDCEERSDGPRHLESKGVVKDLRRQADDAPVRTRVTRTRCLGLCPRKALAAVALGDSLAAMSASLQDEADIQTLARYAFGPGSAKG